MINSVNVRIGIHQADEFQQDDEFLQYDKFDQDDEFHQGDEYHQGDKLQKGDEFDQDDLFYQGDELYQRLQFFINIMNVLIRIGFPQMDDLIKVINSIMLFNFIKVMNFFMVSIGAYFVEYEHSLENKDIN